jgi:hypothetical protein
VVLQTSRPGRGGALTRWVRHRMYASRGRRDGRRSLPLLSSDTAYPTPVLDRLRDQMAREVAQLRAAEVEATAASRVSLAGIVAPEGERAREELRLQELLARLEVVKATGPSTDRRLGEDDLTEAFVRLRRQREHDRRLRGARKRVELQRTVVSALASREHALRAGLEEARRSTEAQVPLAGGDRRSEAVTYLDGALGTHPQRRALSEVALKLTPRPPARLMTTDEVTA